MPGFKRALLVVHWIAIAVLLALTFVALVWVVPVFEKMFADFGQPLPWQTRALVSVSHFVRDYWLLFAGVAVAASLFATMRKPAARRRLEQVVRRISPLWLTGILVAVLLLILVALVGSMYLPIYAV